MDLIVLSTSPAPLSAVFTPPGKSAKMTLSSSPSLPSPSQLFSSMPLQTKAGSRAVSFPNDAVAGFTTASSLLREARSMDPDGSSPRTKRLCLADRHGLEARDNPPSRKVEKSNVGNGIKPVFKRPKILENHGSAPFEPDEQPPETGIQLSEKDTHQIAQDEPSRKPGKKKTKKAKEEIEVPVGRKRRKKIIEANEVQLKMKNPKITKPETAKASKVRKGSNEKKKHGQAQPLGIMEDSLIDPLEAPLDLELAEAVRRRKEWTPVKDDVPRHDEATNESSLIEVPQFLPIVQFGQLMSDFGFAGGNPAAVSTINQTPLPDSESCVKRREIDLVAGTVVPLIPIGKPKRIKSPKKKAQTITEKATAPFAAVSEDSSASSLLQYMTTPASGLEAGLEPIQDAVPKLIGKSLGKPKAKANAAKTLKSKKQNEKAPVLLSPQTAIKTARDQDLVFGTSSQLAREEFPSVHGNLQNAIQDSKSDQAHSVFNMVGESSLSLPPSIGKVSNLLAFTPSRNLWYQANRGFDDSLLEAEMVDLANTPRPPHKVVEAKQSQSSRMLADVHSGANEEPNPEGVAAPANALDDNHERVEEDQALPRSVAEAALRKRPKSRSPDKKASRPKSSTPSEMPSYHGFTDVQLSKAIKAFGFKPVKGRETMIELLEKCWASKKSVALQELPSNINLQPPCTSDKIDTNVLSSSNPARKKSRPPKERTADSPPKKPRGRPKKNPSTSTPPAKRKAKIKSPSRPLSSTMVDPADDIDDPCPPTPTPPRRRFSSKTPKKLLSPSRSKTVPSLNHDRDTPEGRSRLMAQITKAVMEFPPTHDPKNLTWYEKILTYDPIVLEDLTVWLNTIGLNGVEEDDEVWPGLVKEWCEAKSICCLWRKNLRGGVRARW